MTDVTTLHILDVRGSVHHSTIHTEKSNKMQQCPSTYAKPEAASAVLGS